MRRRDATSNSRWEILWDIVNNNNGNGSNSDDDNDDDVSIVIMMVVMIMWIIIIIIILKIILERIIIMHWLYDYNYDGSNSHVDMERCISWVYKQHITPQNNSNTRTLCWNRTEWETHDTAQTQYNQAVRQHQFGWWAHLFVGCLMSQEHASVSQGRICTDNFACCHTEIEVADQTFYLTQSQYTDTWLTSPCADPLMPGAWQGNH